MVDQRQPQALPVRLVDSLPAEASIDAERWWQTLPSRQRQHLAASWELERTIGDRTQYDTGSLAVLLDARFVDCQGADAELELQRQESRVAASTQLDWLLGHTDLPLVVQQPGHHICRAHANARAAVRSGVLRHDFRCPLDRATCPMRKLLDHRKGCSAVLCVVGLARIGVEVQC